jgi:DNA repair protein RadC
MLAISELPRERLVRDGVEALSVQELVAILLGTGMRGKSVLVLAQELVLLFGGLEGLLNASIEELKRVKGIGEAKAILLKAAFGLALRSAKEAQLHQPLLKTPEEVYAIAKTEIGCYKKEVILLFLRNVRGRLIYREVISIGILSEVLIHPREVLSPAIRHQAHSFILVHNHPSGDPSPSNQDIQVTHHIFQSARIIGIEFDDHLIIGRGCFFSMRRKGFFTGTANLYS